ncbi:MAG: nicotinate-nucleotide adenylyltransferase [Miltoncostaeaceae bacterium]
MPRSGSPHRSCTLAGRSAWPSSPRTSTSSPGTGTSGSAQRVGVLGGSFDPPHIGHLVVAAEALWRLGLDELLLVPAGVPPHKPGGTEADGERRLTWCAALAATQPGLSVSRCEIDRAGPSYTADTLGQLAAERPGAALWFLMGSDQLAGLPTWRSPERILALARLGVVPRPPHSLADVEALGATLAPGRVDLVDAPRMDVSSTLVRARLAAGLPVRHLVPHGVWDSLVAEGLVPSPHSS